MKSKIAAPAPLSAQEAWKMLGRSLVRLYKEYEAPILYAALTATWTWIFIARLG